MLLGAAGVVRVGRPLPFISLVSGDQGSSAVPQIWPCGPWEAGLAWPPGTCFSGLWVHFGHLYIRALQFHWPRAGVRGDPKFPRPTLVLLCGSASG